jgi:hypothetical protein
MSIADFFNALTLQMIESFVDEGQEEHLSLEFKTVAGPELNAGNDRKTFAKALSGFANSAGGVIVWGIGTTKSASGNDAASSRAPILNVAMFVQRLAEFTSLYVTPSVVGVAHRQFELPNGDGFAATYVPESDAGPHMALVGLDRYFKRGSVGFYPLQHFDVSDMFGRRQRPALRIELSDPSCGKYGAGSSQVRIFASLVNDGRASAIAPFVRLQVEASFRVNPLGFTSRDQGSSLQLVTEASEPPAYALVGNRDSIIHPGVRFQVAEIVAEIADHERVPGCIVKYSTAAVDAALAEGTILIEPLRIAVALSRAVDGIPRGY